jgi:membrane protease YdiL (CAAX protease family)
MQNISIDGSLPLPQLMAGMIYGLALLSGIVLLIRALIQIKQQRPDCARLNQLLYSRAWDPKELLFLLLLYTLLLILAGLSGSFFYEEQQPALRLIVTYVVWGGLMACTGWIIHRKGENWNTAFGLSRAQSHALKKSLPLYLITLPVVVLSALLFSFLLHLFGVEPAMQDVAHMIFQAPPLFRLLLIFSAIIGAPIVEEILFRGILFPTLARHIGIPGAIGLSSILFALLHNHLNGFLPLTVLSIAFCLAYWRYGSLWVNIGMHALYNGINIVMLLLHAEVLGL